MTIFASPGCIRAVVASALVACALPAFADVPITAVPPADYHARGNEKVREPTQFLLAAGASGLHIALPAPTAAERATLAARNAASTHNSAKANKLKGPLAVAFPRDVPASGSAISLAGLDWQSLPDGRRAAKIEVVSPGAAALRVALAFSSGQMY